MMGLDISDIKRISARNRKQKKKTKGLSKTQAKTVRRLAKEVQLRTCETKHVLKFDENIQLFHNKPLYVGRLLSTTQGTQDPNEAQTNQARIGDEILLKNVNVRFWMSNKQDRPNVMYKAVLFWYNADDTLNDALVYHTQQNKMLDRYNTEKISIIDQKILHSREDYSVENNYREHSYLMTLNGNWKSKKIVYNENSDLPKKRDIGFALVCYDAYGTAQTDNIASVAYNRLVAFKDP